MGIFSRVKNLLNFSENLVSKSGQSKYKIFFDFLCCKLIYGADKEDYVGLELYRKSSAERKKFITCRRNNVFLYNNFYTPKDRDLLESKCLFNPFFSQFIDRRWISTKSATIEEIEKFIDDLKEVIIKPDLGLQGIGVFKLKSSDKLKREEFIKMLEKKDENFIIEEVIIQHPEMAFFNSSCVNTCRIETMTDRNGKAHIINTIIITGGKNSEVSNTHTGGVMMHVDENSGIVDSKGRNPDGLYFLTHPGTHVLLIGHKIPYWDEVIGLALKLAEFIPTARFVGWDIAITEKGPVLVEGNIKIGHCTQACDMVGRWPLIKSYL